MNTMENMEMTIMSLILFSGNARSMAMEAIRVAKAGEFEEAESLLQQAAEEIGNAHHSQTSLIQGEARGEKTELSMLLIHAQDHLMTAMTLKELAVEIVALHKVVASK
ncbi:MAG: PTS lactose/cellobiose transporter subunit IIA [Bacilli bacterium]